MKKEFYCKFTNMAESEIKFDDCGEMQPFSTVYGEAESITKCRRLLKTALINMSFIAMVNISIMKFFFITFLD